MFIRGTWAVFDARLMASPLRLELRDQLAQQVEDAADVDVEGALPVLLAERLQRAHAQHAGGVTSTSSRGVSNSNWQVRSTWPRSAMSSRAVLNG